MEHSYRIIVISDTHGDFQILHRIVKDRLDEAYCFIHLGDGEWEVDHLRSLYPELRLYSVRGNCDFDSNAKVMDEIMVGGKQILFTHGHLKMVKYGLDSLKSAARNCDADIVLYGHTHISFTDYEDGLYIMNPGSAGRPRETEASFGVIDITPAGIVLNIVPISSLERRFF